MKDVDKQIEDFKKAHPDIAEAMEIFKLGMNEYQQAYKFLNDPQICTSNSTDSSCFIQRS